MSKRIGRPLLGQTTKSAAISIKVEPEMRNFLQAAADRNGRSFTQEIEIRLQASRIEGSDKTSASTSQFLRLLAIVIGEVETLIGCDWNENEESLSTSQGAMDAIIQHFGQVSTVAALRDILQLPDTPARRDELVAHNLRIAKYHQRGSDLANDATRRLIPGLLSGNGRG